MGPGSSRFGADVSQRAWIVGRLWHRRRGRGRFCIVMDLGGHDVRLPAPLVYLASLILRLWSTALRPNFRHDRHVCRPVAVSVRNVERAQLWRCTTHLTRIDQGPLRQTVERLRPLHRLTQTKLGRARPGAREQLLFGSQISIARSVPEGAGDYPACRSKRPSPRSLVGRVFRGCRRRMRCRSRRRCLPAPPRGFRPIQGRGPSGAHLRRGAACSSSQ